VTRLPPVGYGLTVLELRAREQRRAERKAEETQAVAAELGFTLADGSRPLSRAELEALANGVRAEAAHRRALRRAGTRSSS
jgi:hypothetical protein